jgi:hypothetical protein
MTTEKELATRPTTTNEFRPNTAAFEPSDVREALALAQVLSKSNLVPKALATHEAVFYVIAAGRELGFSVVQSLRSLHIIDGKIVMSADLMVSQVLRSGLAEHFSLVESSDKVATYETKRRGSPTPTRMSYSIEQAARAGLVGKQNWKNHPEAMLRARCASALARAVYPDAVQGMYDPDEAEEIRRQSAVPASVVSSAQSTPPASEGKPASAPIDGTIEDPAAKWLDKIGKSAEQKKPIQACVGVAEQIAEHTSNGVRARCIKAWAEQLEKLVRAKITTQEAIDALRGAILKLPEDIALAGVRVCDALNPDAEPAADADASQGEG